MTIEDCKPGRLWPIEADASDHLHASQRPGSPRKSRRKGHMKVLAVSLALALGASAMAQPRYTVKDLGVWQGVAMNNAGTIVGWSASGEWDSLIYDGNTLGVL